MTEVPDVQEGLPYRPHDPLPVPQPPATPEWCPQVIGGWTGVTLGQAFP